MLDRLPGEPVEIPYARIEGEAGDGPHLALLAGVHGGEYTSMAAVRTFVAEVDVRRLKGSITAVPILNQPAFWARSAFVVPADGKNLNRCFPGDTSGSYSEALAHAVLDAFIRPVDHLVDLHAGDIFEALEPFCLYDESPVGAQARELALAYGNGHVVRQSSATRTVGGSTSSAAADLGIPAIVAEIGGNGICDEASVAGHVRGIRNVCAHLGMLPAEPGEPAPAPVEHDGWIWMRSSVRGWWHPQVAVGDRVHAGELLGCVLDPFGEELERVIAPADGCPLFLTTSPAVAGDGLLLGLATP
nr:succinylglutamate desuccinylase/aspartoacylase family protein [Petropleomorpha daqingensis]